MCRHALTHGVPAGTALNVNIPKKSATPIAGLRLARQARAKWAGRIRPPPRPLPAPLLLAPWAPSNLDPGTDTDEWALATTTCQ